MRWILTALLASLALLPATACQPSRAEWADIPGSPAAEAYAGAATAPLDRRIEGRVAERAARILGDRVERLPPGVTWAQHLAYRDAHAQLLRRVPERVPEPDAPVLYAEWSRSGRTLYAVAVVDDTGRLVVRTTLTGPR